LEVRFLGVDGFERIEELEGFGDMTFGERVVT